MSTECTWAHERHHSNQMEKQTMIYSIVGTGTVGSTLARIFARAGVNVAIANTRGPETINLDSSQRANVTPVTIVEALEADIIFAAVQFGSVKAFGQSRDDWTGRIIVDVTNAFGVDPAVFGGRTSSELVADWLPGARVVKAMNHLPYEVFETAIHGENGRRAVFVSSNDPDASSTVARLAEEVGFAPIELGRLDEGGRLLGLDGPLLCKNLVEYPFG